MYNLTATLNEQKRYVALMKQCAQNFRAKAFQLQKKNSEFGRQYLLSLDIKKNPFTLVKFEIEKRRSGKKMQIGGYRLILKSAFCTGHKKASCNAFRQETKGA